MFFSWKRERSLKHKAADVVVSFKVCPFVVLLLFIKVGHHICHLDVGKLGVQVFRIHLHIKHIIMNATFTFKWSTWLKMEVVLPYWSPESSLRYQLQTCLSRASAISGRLLTVLWALAPCRWTLYFLPHQRSPNRTHTQTCRLKQVR